MDVSIGWKHDWFHDMLSVNDTEHWACSVEFTFHFSCPWHSSSVRNEATHGRAVQLKNLTLKSESPFPEFHSRLSRCYPINFSPFTWFREEFNSSSFLPSTSKQLSSLDLAENRKLIKLACPSGGFRMHKTCTEYKSSVVREEQPNLEYAQTKLSGRNNQTSNLPFWIKRNVNSAMGFAGLMYLRGKISSVCSICDVSFGGAPHIKRREQRPNVIELR